ncbi:MAG: ABC transporter ATP-binding protein [Gaiellaceae bacterium]
MTAAIAANGLSKRYRIGELQSSYGTLRESLARAAKQFAKGPHRHHHEEIWALHDISFDVPEGQVLGVIGGNGAGKSTLLKILTRITTPTSGRAEIRGRVGSLLEVGTGFHPELTGRENVFLNGSVLGMKRREISRKLDEIVDFAGVERFIDTPVKRYSSGMYVRLAFAVAAHLEPEILLVDEVLAVGDAEFQRRCLGRMEDFGQSGRTVLFVSHNMQAIGRLCERTILLEGGRIAQDGHSADVVAKYLQSGRGSGSSREWTEEDPVWSDGTVQLRWIRIVQDGRAVESADVRRPIGIELAFDVLDDKHAVFPKIKVKSGEGEIVFNALDTNPRWHEPAAPGPYVSTAWIPANLLNEGLFTVDPAVTSLGTGKLLPHTGERQAVSFHVHDTGEGDSARGNYSGQLRGTVRPLLEWTTEER